MTKFILSCYDFRNNLLCIPTDVQLNFPLNYFLIIFVSSLLLQSLYEFMLLGYKATCCCCNRDHNLVVMSKLKFHFDTQHFESQSTLTRVQCLQILTKV